jgi:uncharacterized membrane protein YdbT with pleckstrin-like domain
MARNQGTKGGGIMGYIERNLMDGEHIVYRSALHWVIFIWPIVWFIVALALFGVGVNMNEANVKRLMVYAGGMFMIIVIVTFIRPTIKYITSEFGITTRRVIMKIGVIRRKSLEVLLNKVESIQVDQSMSGRILGFGSITVTGTGGTRDVFHNIKAPFEFRKKALEQIGSGHDPENR